MIKRKLFVFSLFTLFLISSCKSTKIQEPLWVTDYKAVYNQDEYLTGFAEGSEKLEAKNNAIANLSSYLSTNVQRVTESEYDAVQKTNGQVESEKKVNVHTITTTDLELFALETTEPFYKKSEKKWYCVAFINKNTAWNQYSLNVQAEKDKFYSVYNLAKNEENPFEKIKLLKSAQKQSEDFTNQLYKLYVFSKEKTNKVYSDDRKLIAEIPSEILKAKKDFSVFVKTNQDNSNLILSTVEQVFTQNDFYITNETSCRYNVFIDIDFNKVIEEELIVFNPIVKVSIQDKKSDDKIIFNYSTKVEQILSYNLSKATKNTCEKIATKLSEELDIQIAKMFEN